MIQPQQKSGRNEGVGFRQACGLFLMEKIRDMLDLPICLSLEPVTNQEPYEDDRKLN